MLLQLQNSLREGEKGPRIMNAGLKVILLKPLLPLDPSMHPLFLVHLPFSGPPRSSATLAAICMGASGLLQEETWTRQSRRGHRGRKQETRKCGFEGKVKRIKIPAVLV